MVTKPMYLRAVGTWGAGFTGLAVAPLYRGGDSGQQELAGLAVGPSCGGGQWVAGLAGLGVRFHQLC